MSSKPSFLVSELDYSLPPELIAQSPPENREDARMLCLDRATHHLRDGRICEFPECLNPGDLLVVNNTRVLPAKFAFRRATGGRIEGLFLEEVNLGEWIVLLDGAGRLRGDEKLAATGRTGEKIELVVCERLDGGRCRVSVEPQAPAERILEEIGTTPLPPYIRRSPDAQGSNKEDRERYQTVYAKRAGAVAAPTAGLHLTENLLDRIRNRGVEIAEVTLHVGMGTFQPVTVADLADHAMHSERFEVCGETIDALQRCKSRGGRVVAVGTTTVRVLESLKVEAPLGSALDCSGSTNLLIYPPFSFRYVDALLTNFHLPKSTLLALVMALAGVDTTRRAYAHAMEQRYRFFSYGDAMFVS